jgi:hypothetical protein
MTTTTTTTITATTDEAIDDPYFVPTTILECMKPLMYPLSIQTSATTVVPTTTNEVIIHANGNLVDAINNHQVDVAIHCCNCLHTMGRGMALALRKACPNVFVADLKSPKGDSNKLGTYTHALYADKAVTIINLYGQYAYGYTKRNLCYKAIRVGLGRIFQNLPPNARVGTYWLGCSNAGGDKKVVHGIFLEAAKQWNTTIHVYDVQL